MICWRCSRYDGRRRSSRPHNRLDVRRSLYSHINARIENFILYYGDKGFDLSRINVNQDNALSTIESLVGATGRAGHPVYLLIDEYDNFANTVMMLPTLDSRDRYTALVHDEGVLRTFFKMVKSSTGGVMFDRVFITGVSPVVLSDITSGYNIAEDIFFEPEFGDSSWSGPWGSSASVSSTRMTWKDSPLHLFVFKADDIAIFAIEFHADQIEFISLGAVFLMVSLLLDLFQSAIFTCIPIHHLEFQNKNPPFQFDGQINPAMICGVLRRDVQPKSGKIAIKDRGVIAFILGYLIFAVPVVRNGCEK